jgi:prepilin-type N-terminal cleavage/methylation domain-containing protein
MFRRSRLNDSTEEMMRFQNRRGDCRAFTLVELLVVIAIIGVLVAMLMPALSKARRQAQLVQCMSGARQAFLGVDMYCHDYKNYYPQGDKDNSVPWHALLASRKYISEALQTNRGCPWGPDSFNPAVSSDYYTPPATPTVSYGLNGMLQGGYSVAYDNMGVPLGQWFGPIYPALYQAVGRGGGWQPTPTAGRHQYKGVPVALADGHVEFMTTQEILTWPWSREAPIMYWSYYALGFRIYGPWT